jgi:adenylate cyclase, class 2
MSLEREIKLRFESADTARTMVVALGATPLRSRRLQEDALLDTAEGRLAARRAVLRVRHEGGHSLLTFKGPPQPGPMKLREEVETVVADGQALMAILQALGLSVCFRYEKYREEFALEDVVIAIDETPVGVFIEIEGAEQSIEKTAQGLGRVPGEYITDSYRALFIAARERQGLTGEDMVFPDPARA